MTIEEYMMYNNLKTEEDLCQHFRDNVGLGKLPVSMYSCIVCGEILADPRDGCFKCARLKKGV